MRRSLVIVLVASLPWAAWAADPMEPVLRTQSMAAVAAAVPPARNTEAPFRAFRDPLPELTLRQELDARAPRRAGCENAADLCYDLVEGRVVYRPARAYMPTIEGLRAENISVRQDRVVFKYSFR
jgi:hypothetical protein